jgi:hypothetical protein
MRSELLGRLKLISEALLNMERDIEFKPLA